MDAQGDSSKATVTALRHNIFILWTALNHQTIANIFAVLFVNFESRWDGLIQVAVALKYPASVSLILTVTKSLENLLLYKF